MNTNVYTSMTIFRNPNWITDKALGENGIVPLPDLSFKTISPALRALRSGNIKQLPDFVLIDEGAANRAQKGTALLAHAFIELCSHVLIVMHDEGEIGQLQRISLNHGTEPVLDTNLGANIGRKIESL